MFLGNVFNSTQSLCLYALLVLILIRNETKFTILIDFDLSQLLLTWVVDTLERFVYSSTASSNSSTALAASLLP